MSTPEQARAAIVGALVEVAPEIDAAAVPEGIPLQEAFELDSMDFLAVLEGIAARTGVEVPERDLAAISTLEGCTAYVAAQMDAARS
jgi:acyl carrier protein